MATESCPRCGEKAINQTGHCVFCGAVVIAPTTKPSGKEYDKAMRAYKFVSISFLILGILYIAAAVIGSASAKKPLIGLFLDAGFVLAHGVLLIMNNDWIRSITKVACGIRLAALVICLLSFGPYMLNIGATGPGFFAVFLFDAYCLVLMIKTIDEVYFA